MGIWKMNIPPGGSSRPLFPWNLECWFMRSGRNLRRKTRRKTLGARTRTGNKPDAMSGNQTRAREASVLTAVPAPRKYGNLFCLISGKHWYTKLIMAHRWRSDGYFENFKISRNSLSLPLFFQQGTAYIMILEDKVPIIFSW